jgi:hypothetical protein
MFEQLFEREQSEGDGGVKADGSRIEGFEVSYRGQPQRRRMDSRPMCRTARVQAYVLSACYLLVQLRSWPSSSAGICMTCRRRWSSGGGPARATAPVFPVFLGVLCSYNQSII